jgi:hypothetical protein
VLWHRPTAGGTATALVKDATHDIENLTFSRDGSRLAYMQRTLNSTGDIVSTQIVVRDVSSRIVRVVASVLDAAGEVSQPTLSPDGTTVAWTNLSASGPALYRAGAGSGSPVLVKGGYMDGVFLDSSTLLAQSAANGSWASVTLAGATTANATLTSSSFDVAVSEDGQHLAWAEDTSVSSTSTSNIETATLSVSSGVATVGTPAQVATGLANEAPSFSVDGSKVYFVEWDGDQGEGDVWVAPTVADGANPPAVSANTPGEDDYDVAIGTTDDGTPPAAAGTAVPAALGATTATVKWTLPADADLSGVVLTRTLGATVQKTVYVPAPVTSYADTGLVVNNAYVSSITAVDRSGHSASAATRSVTPMSPGAVVTDPTTNTATRAPFAVRFAAAAPSNAKFTVDYNVAGTTTWYRWVTALTGITRTFGAPATSGVAATTATPGASYNFRVTAVDGAGNSTAAITAGKGVVPFDQTKATLSGGATLASTSSFMGSIYQLKTTASYAKVTLLGNRLQVVGIKCPGCGLFAIYDGSTKVANVDTYASTTKVRQVLFAKTYTAIGTHTFTIRPLATAGRPAVELDGFAMRR